MKATESEKAHVAYYLLVDIVNKMSELHDISYNPNFKNGYINIPDALLTMKNNAQIVYNKHFAN